MNEIINKIKNDEIQVDINKIARIFIKNGSIDIDYINVWNTSIMEKDIENMKYSIYEFNELPFNALEWYAENGNLEMVDFLCKKSLNIFSKNISIFTDDLCEIEYSFLTVMVFRIQKKKINNIIYDNHKKNIALQQAAKNGHLEIVQYLAEYIHDDKDQALVISIINNRVEIIKFILNYDNKINYRDNKFIEASIIAGNLEIFKLLVENGAPILDRSFDAYRGHLHIIEYCIKKEDKCQRTYDEILKVSAACGFPDIVEFILKNGANVHFNEDIALREAIEEQHNDIVKILLPLYKKEELQKLIDYHNIKNRILNFLLKNPNHSILVEIYREYGIDIFDLIEKEIK